MPLAVAVRPEKIRISKNRPDGASNLFSGKVREIAYFGSYSTFIVDVTETRKVRITASNTVRADGGAGPDASAITWGDLVYFWWDDSAAVALTQ